MLWRVRTTIDDRPGFLSVLTASLALRSINILAVQVYVAESGAVDDFLLEAPDTLTAQDILAAVTKGRGRDTWIDHADPRSLIDEPTRVLALAARASSHPEQTADVLSDLLGGCVVTRRGAGDPDAASSGELTEELLLSDPRGGVYHAHREDPPFTPAERARAAALIELVATSCGLSATS